MSMENQVEIVEIDENINLLIDSCIEELARDNLNGMEKLYELTSTMIYGYAFSLLKNKTDAEDIVHDCYLAVYKASNQYQTQGKPVAWMLTITRNLCLQKIRDKKNEYDQPLEEAYYIPVQENLTIAEKETLKHYMAALTDEEKEIVMLHAIAGLKHREIAKIVNKSLPAVLSKYHRAIKRLKEMVKEDELK